MEHDDVNMDTEFAQSQHQNLHHFMMKRKLYKSSSLSTASRPSCVVVALFQGKGRFKCEVGLAVIDLYYPHLVLYQISDNYIFSNTLAKINVFHPVEVIVPKKCTSDSNKKLHLPHIIERKCPNINITEVPRIHFSALVGWNLIQEYCSNNDYSVQLLVKKKLYALSAASALIKYIVYIQKITYAPKSVKIEFKSNDNTAMIDIEATELLEITYSLNKACPKYSLFNVLNKCVTPLGKKLLRSNLLQPLTNINEINDRLECVSELIENFTLFSNLQEILNRFKYMDIIVSTCPVMDDYKRNQQTEKNLNFLLYLKRTLEVLPQLCTILSITSSSIFQRIKASLSDDRFIYIRELISELIHEDATYVRGFTSSNIQRCFAIKPKINDLLDIIRQAYCELIDNMIQYVQKLSSKYNLSLTLSCNYAIGYYMELKSLDKSAIQTFNLPKELMLIRKEKKILFLTTEQLLSDSSKCKEMCEEIHIISNMLISNLLENLSPYVTLFFELCTNVSELDFLASLASISSKPGFVRPQFSHKLCVIDSYHPVQLLSDFKNCVHNNIIASVPYNFHVITGPNLSGKTSYMKQIFLLHILAQIGCYVPAKKAQFRISDAFFFHSSHFYNDEASASSFEKEIRRLKSITDLVTDNSLVGLDEPCVTADYLGGTSLAAAICMKILSTRAFGFCSTHYSYLTKLSESFYNVTNLCFEGYPQTSESMYLTYTHKLKVGVTDIDYYGIAVARLSSLPESVIKHAEEIAKMISAKEKIKTPIISSESKSVDEINYSMVAKMYNLIKLNKFTATACFKLINNYRKSNSKFIDQNCGIEIKINIRHENPFYFLSRTDKIPLERQRLLLQLCICLDATQNNVIRQPNSTIDNLKHIESVKSRNNNDNIQLTDAMEIQNDDTFLSPMDEDLNDSNMNITFSTISSICEELDTDLEISDDDFNTMDFYTKLLESNLSLSNTMEQ